MRAIAIIPARAGSKRIPRKNVRPFHGKPIIEYSIEAAKASGLFSDIYVSTDDEEALNISIRQGCYVHIRSTAALCGDEAGTQEVAQDCLLHSTSAQHDYCCVIYPTAPMLRPQDLRFGLDMIQALDHTYDFVYVPAWYYWGRVDRMIINPQVTKDNSLVLTPCMNRWVDINEEEDWQRAERMYAGLHELRQEKTINAGVIYR